MPAQHSVLPRRASRARPTGRPTKSTHEIPTRDRLLYAAVQVFIDRGFSHASLTEIAEHAGISGPAVYKHFAGKADLLIAAAKQSLNQMSGTAPDSKWGPKESTRLWLSPEFAPTRRLLLELHLVAGREADVLDLLAAWHRDRANAWMDARPHSLAQVKAFYLLLLGLSQADSLSSLDADGNELQHHVDRMVDALFTDSPDEPRS